MTRAFAFAALGVILGLIAVHADAQPPNVVLGKTSPEWVEILKTHKELRFRRAALIALEVFGPRTAGVLPAITNALENDSDPAVRREAAMLLGRMGGDAKGSVFALADALTKDKSELVREAAAQALGGKLNEFADGHVLTLADALSDAHPGTRAAAAEAILKLGDRAGPALPKLLTLAKDTMKDRFSRQYAIKCIARLGPDDRDVAGVLIDVLAEKTAATAIRVDAADGLGRSTVSADKVLPPLVSALGDPAVEVRRASASALAKQGKDARAVWADVKKSLTDADSAVRYQLIRLAGHLAAIDELAQHAKKDAHAENRIAAIQELGRNPGPVSIETLTFLVENDPTAAIRDAAETALKKLMDQ